MVLTLHWSFLYGLCGPFKTLTDWSRVTEVESVYCAVRTRNQISLLFISFYDVALPHKVKVITTVKTERKGFGSRRLWINWSNVTALTSSLRQTSKAVHQDTLTFRHRTSCITGQAFRYSPENAFCVFNPQIYFIIWYLLGPASLR